MIERINACRFVTPLREGGSLPGIMEADDLGTYVVKFRGAGQGLKVLVAEVIVTELARRLQIPTPELRAIEVGRSIARYEADEEVQDLLTASLGLNLAVDFLPGSFGWHASAAVSADEAARILWLDGLTANVDRTWRNPNLLLWHGGVWAIDHGASLYFHHSWASRPPDPARFAAQPYDYTDHALSAHLGEVSRVDADLTETVTESMLRDVLLLVPDEWLEPMSASDEPDGVREQYVAYLTARLESPRRWLPGVQS